MRYSRRARAQQIAAKTASEYDRKAGKFIRTKPLPRACFCGHRLSSGDSALVEVHADEAGHAHYSKVAYCAGVWVCPVCSAVIRTQRAKDVSTAIENWQAMGGSAYMVTLTTRHHRGDDLGKLLGCLEESWRGAGAGRPWRRIKEEIGIVGYVRTLEVTYSDRNGFHPHYHFLFFSEGDATEEKADKLRRYLYGKWSEQIAANGGKLPDEEHGVDVQVVGRDGKAAGMYVAKVADGSGAAQEIARADAKEGRGGDEVGSLTPFQFLDLDGAKYENLWNVYVAAMKGKWSVYFSKGMRDLCGLGGEKSNEEIIAEMTATGTTAAAIEGKVHDRMRRDAGMLAEALAMIERGLVDELAEMLGCVVAVEDHLDFRTGSMESYPVIRMPYGSQTGAIHD